MDASEATKIVMSRIQSLDPENASRIMGYILIQDQGEKEMIRLAFGPDALLLSYVNQAKAYFALHSSSNSLRSNNVFPQMRIPIPNYTNPCTSPRPISSSYAGSVLNGAINDSASQFYGNDESIMSPSARSDSLVSSPHPHPFHRRSHSVNDAALFLSNLEEGGFGVEEGGFVRPCMYFAKGFCKNGSACKFFHGDNCGDETIESGSPSANGFDEFLRMKALQQRRFARMASEGRHHFNFNENRRCGPRNELSQLGLGAALTSSSRQIYLTFPADSPFREEDVSSYFSMFGPVQDVRIPYQQKRMFGFVTFVSPETVKIILAKGNPHFVCDSRVLVKPYKEKGKVPDKKQLQQQLQYLEREENTSYLSPSSKELFDPPIGTQEMILRRKLEQEVALQHALEIQGRRITNLQLMGLKYQQHNHRFLPSLPGGVPISSPRSQLMGENAIATSDAGSQDVLQEFDNGQETSNSSADDEKLMMGGPQSSTKNGICSSDNHQDDGNDPCLPESLEPILPDNLFSSPTKSVAEHRSIFSRDAPTEANKALSTNNSPSTSPLRMASLC